MRAPRLSMLRRPRAPSTALGILVAASFIAVETVAVVLLKHLNPGEAFETLYLLGVLVVSTVWGVGLATATSVASAIALDYFRNWPTAHFMPFVLENEVAIVVFLFVALSTNFVAGLARARAVEADQRGREASLLFQQQAALRRVATLVANGVGPSAVFAAVAEEMARCLRVVHAMVLRSEPDGAVVVAVYDERLSRRLPVGERLTLEGDNVTGGVLRTGRVVRMDSYENAPGSTGARMRQLGLRGAVGAPVVVDGRVWGAATVGSVGPEPLPPDTEARISDFADLVATTISNAAARAELRASNDSLGVLAEQQAALRRVATLVARGVRPAQVFAAVADEMARCLDVADSEVVRYDGNDAAIILASYNAFGLQTLQVGERVTLEGDNVATMVLQTARAARMDHYENAAGSLSARVRELGMHSVAAAPVIVDGRVWGAAFVSSRRPEPLPPDIEERIADFADLVATALANAATGAELIASRARIVAAGDNARRRLERDLHDGAQQRLVSLGVQIRAFEASMPGELGVFKQQLSEIVSGLTGVSKDLQEISRGIHPAILSRGGLSPALKTLARRSTVPVRLDVAIDRRLPDPTEVAAYYVVAEALTNTAKHAQASEVDVRVETKNGNLGIVIRDDGIGGANSGKGSGLVGLKDRVEALGGRMQITSQPGNGTSLHATIPLEVE